MGIRREERVSEMKLICIRRRNKEPGSHAHREEICAVAASDRDGLEQAGARNTHSKDGVAEGAMDIAELVGGGGGGGGVGRELMVVK